MVNTVLCFSGESPWRTPGLTDLPWQGTGASISILRPQNVRILTARSLRQSILARLVASRPPVFPILKLAAETNSTGGPLAPNNTERVGLTLSDLSVIIIVQPASMERLFDPHA